MQKMCIDALCGPGHKGLYGIQGCGFGILRSGLSPDTLIEGGSGYASLEAAMPESSPERWEAGTLPTPAIAGLCEGIKCVRRIGVDAIHEHERRLFIRLAERLAHLKGYHVYLPEYAGSTLMFHRTGIPSEKIGQYLSQKVFAFAQDIIVPRWDIRRWERPTAAVFASAREYSIGQTTLTRCTRLSRTWSKATK